MAPPARERTLNLASGINHQDIQPGQEGYVIVSRWGRTLHKLGCTCAPCRARRKGGERPVCEQAKGGRKPSAKEVRAREAEREKEVERERQAAKARAAKSSARRSEARAAAPRAVAAAFKGRMARPRAASAAAKAASASSLPVRRGRSAGNAGSAGADGVASGGVTKRRGPPRPASKPQPSKSDKGKAKAAQKSPLPKAAKAAKALKAREEPTPMEVDAAVPPKPRVAPAAALSPSLSPPYLTAPEAPQSALQSPAVPAQAAKAAKAAAKKPPSSMAKSLPKALQHPRLPRPPKSASQAGAGGATSAGKRGIHKDSCNCIICQTRAAAAAREAAGGPTSPPRKRAPRKSQAAAAAVSAALAATAGAIGGMGGSMEMDPVQAVAAAELAAVLAETAAAADTAEAAAAVIARLQRCGALAGEMVEYRPPPSAPGAAGAMQLPAPLRGSLVSGGGVRCPAVGAAPVSLAHMARLCAAQRAPGGRDARHYVDGIYMVAGGASLRQHVATLRAAAGSPARLLTRTKGSGGADGGAQAAGAPGGRDVGGASAAHRASAAAAILYGMPPAVTTAPHVPPGSAVGTSVPRKARDPSRHRFAIDIGDDVADGAMLRYIDNDGVVLLVGQKRSAGILCRCCSRIVTALTFEAHAGRPERKSPYDRVFLDNGTSLRAVADARQARLAARYGGAVPGIAGGYPMVPQTTMHAPPHAPPLPGAPHAPETGGHASHQTLITHFAPPSPQQRRGEAGAHSGGGAAGPMSPEGLLTRCRRIAADLDIVQGGCVLCRAWDFELEGFAPRTVMVCEQCEREFHVGCLRRYGRADLKALPEGDWHCSPECAAIGRTLGEQISVGLQPVLPGDPRWARHSFALLKGDSGDGTKGKLLRDAHRIITLSFDPIMDLATGKDLVPLMVYSKGTADHDFSNMLCVVVCHDGKPVCSAVLRVFGRHLAEMPLVATDHAARRQGHCRALVIAVEQILARAGVEKLSLPAAATAVSTWTHGFGFKEMPQDQRRWARAELRMLHFPGSTLLQKPVRPVAPVAPVAVDGHHGAGIAMGGTTHGGGDATSGSEIGWAAPAGAPAEVASR